MSAAPVNGLQEPSEADTADAASKKAVKYDSGARDLEKVTDYAEEKEVISVDQFQGVWLILLFVYKKKTYFMNIIFFRLCLLLVTAEIEKQQKNEPKKMS